MIQEDSPGKLVDDSVIFLITFTTWAISRAIPTNTVKKRASRYRENKILKRRKTSASSDNGSKPPPAEPSTDAPEEELTTMSIAARLDEIHAAWEQKTPDKKTDWCKQNLGRSEPPWAGEVAYDDGADIEYESRGIISG